MFSGIGERKMTRRWKIVFSQSHNLLYQAIDVFRQMLFLTYEEMKADLPKVKLPFSSEIFQHWIYLRIQFLGDPKGCWLSGQKRDCWRGAWKQFFYEFNPPNWKTSLCLFTPSLKASQVTILADHLSFKNMKNNAAVNKEVECFECLKCFECLICKFLKLDSMNVKCKT